MNYTPVKKIQQNDTEKQEERAEGRLCIWLIFLCFFEVFILSVVLLGAFSAKEPSPAPPTVTPPQNQDPPAVEDFLFTDTSPLPALSGAGSTLTTELQSTYGILIDAETGEILAGKDANTRFSPASMTKVMTLIVACERLKPSDLSKTVTMTSEIYDYVRDGNYKNTSLYGFDVDDQTTVEALLFGIGIESSSDCSMMVVSYLGLTEAEFVELMNQKAAALELENTHFDNIIGYESPENYSTAADIAKIMMYALRCDTVKRILSYNKEYQFSLSGYNSKGEWVTITGRYYSTLFNVNPDSPSRMKAYEEKYGAFALESASFLGGKTGSLDGELPKTYIYSLVSFAEKDGKLYIAVTGETGVSSAVMKDAKTLYDGYIK